MINTSMKNKAGAPKLDLEGIYSFFKKLKYPCKMFHTLSFIVCINEGTGYQTGQIFPFKIHIASTFIGSVRSLYG